MKKVDKELIKKSANSLMFDMNDDEFESILSEFNIVLNQMTLINLESDLKDYEPMDFPFEIPIENSFFEYKIDVCSKEEITKTSTSTENGMIKIPSVITY